MRADDLVSFTALRHLKIMDMVEGSELSGDVLGQLTNLLSVHLSGVPFPTGEACVRVCNLSP